MPSSDASALRARAAGPAVSSAGVEAVAVGAIFVASGAAALIYEVLWLKQLGLLFGNTAQAAAATLAVFFLGMSLGARALGRRAAQSANPLRAFAGLEVAVAVSALLYFLLLDLYRTLYPALASSLRGVPGGFGAARLLLAAGILLPPAFFMGGTLPFMSQHMVRQRDQLGRTVSWLYACNTVGGALGAFAAAFVLAPSLGYSYSFAVAMTLNLSVAAVAWAMSGKPVAQPAPVAAATASGAVRYDPALLSAVAFFSGAATLGLEVLWTRMFAQVLHNSVYSFATILVIFLIAMAIGAALAHRLWRADWSPAVILPVLLITAGVAAGASPFVFYRVTGGLHYLAPSAGWWSYVASIYASAAVVLLPPGICLGLVFPYVLGMAGEETGESVGSTVGRLASWNTLGSIVGSLACGFVVIDTLGLWGGIRAIAAAYLALAVVLLPRGEAADLRLRAGLAAALLAVLVIFDPTRLTVVSVRSADELLREKWETGHSIVAVTQTGQHRMLKLDNYYSLGGTSATAYEEAQADIPLVIHPAPRKVFFLGLGTGITTGAALRHAVEQVTAAELIPEVVEASRRHFEPYVNGLFEDPRAEVVVEDGRQYLLTTGERYDVIISDLFIPWQAGTGSLYTREHFELVRSRLREGGLFAQWLPLYQLSERDFMVIARTMLEVFPQVTMWRGDFMPDHSIVALVGQEAGARLDPGAVTANFRVRRKTDDMPRDLAMAFVGLFYVNNLTVHRELFADVPINTDDRPIIEYQAPVAQREQAGGERPWFISFPLAQFQAKLLRTLPPARDPYLAELTPAEREYSLAGMDLFSAMVQRSAGNEEQARKHAETFERSVPPQVYGVFRGELEKSTKQEGLP